MWLRGPTIVGANERSVSPVGCRRSRSDSSLLAWKGEWSPLQGLQATIERTEHRFDWRKSRQFFSQRIGSELPGGQSRPYPLRNIGSSPTNPTSESPWKSRVLSFLIYQILRSDNISWCWGCAAGRKEWLEGKIEKAFSFIWKYGKTGNDKIRSFSDGIQSVSENAFAGWYSLTNVSIPKTLRKCMTSLVYMISWLSNKDFRKDAWKEYSFDWQQNAV